jgi:predicted acetylornithine/succinylornithine family transaminase
MGDRLDRAVALDAAHHIGTYRRKRVLFVEGRGMTLVDDEGREYLDFVAGIGAVNLGHSHPAVVEAVREQVGRLTHVSNLYYVEHQGQLAERISELAGGDREVFFANSGAEANEGAIKLARRWGMTHKGRRCVEVVTALNSFHGRTLATLAATGQTAKHEPFEPLPPGFRHVPLNDLEALDAAVTRDTCAVMLEPIQGEGGVHPCERGYLKGVEKLCAERGVLLVLDEVQTGCFRTGTPFGFQGYGVVPDIVTMAKSLANGLPIGAVVATVQASEAFGPGDHATTFGGGPVVCAAGLATLRALEHERLGAAAERVGSYLRERLKAIGRETGAIVDVRGAGLMVGAELAEPVAAQVASTALEHGIVINNIGDTVVRLLPPLVCTQSDADAALGVVHAALTG